MKKGQRIKNGSPHRIAKQEIEKNLINKNSVREITTKTPWGFSEFKAFNQSYEDFLKTEYKYYSDTILHILNGENNQENFFSIFEDIFDKVKNESLRIHILEHNPNHKKWQGKINPLISNKLEKLFKNNNFLFTKEYLGSNGIDSRNMLYTIDTLEKCNLFSFNYKTKDYIVDKWFNTLTCERSEEEYDNANNALFNNNIIEKINNTNSIYSVIGGGMFLDFFFDVKEKPLYLVDISIESCMFAYSVLEILKISPTKKEFEHNRKNVKEVLKYQFDKFNSISERRRWLHRFNYKKNGEKSINLPYRERHPLYQSKWLDNYEKVRKNILNSLKEINLGKICDLGVRGNILENYQTIFTPENSTLYTSTLWTTNFNTMPNRLIINCYEPRNINYILKEINIGE